MPAKHSVLTLTTVIFATLAGISAASAQAWPHRHPGFGFGFGFGVSPLAPGFFESPFYEPSPVRGYPTAALLGRLNMQGYDILQVIVRRPTVMVVEALDPRGRQVRLVVDVFTAAILEKFERVPPRRERILREDLIEEYPAQYPRAKPPAKQPAKRQPPKAPKTAPNYTQDGQIILPPAPARDPSEWGK